MAIDPKTAARIARENGLTLADVRALTLLADTEEEAVDLARQFAPEGIGQNLNDLGGSDLSDLKAALETLLAKGN